jgi:hypothetical protein
MQEQRREGGAPWFEAAVTNALPRAWLLSVSAVESDASPSVCLALDRRLHSCHLRGGALSRRRSTINPRRATPPRATDARLHTKVNCRWLGVC